jgi:hypothetical protein
MRAWTVLLLAFAATVTGCFGSSHRTRPSSTRFIPPRPSTAAAYAGTATTCPKPATYAPRLSPARGAAGTHATITGTLPLYGEDGSLNASLTSGLVGWWNVAFAHWPDLAGTRPRPFPARPGPAFRILDVAVPTPSPCTYRLSIDVPEVAAGAYPIDILVSGGRSTASLAPVRFTVTGP